MINVSQYIIIEILFKPQVLKRNHVLPRLLLRFGVPLCLSIGAAFDVPFHAAESQIWSKKKVE